MVFEMDGKFPMNTKKQQTLRAYHFTNDKLRDGRPIPRKGVWLKHTGEVIPCSSGLHASLHPFDALRYAPGNILHLVEIRGDIQRHDNDKIVGHERKIIKTINAEKLLRDFARWNALRVVHLWLPAPDVVVRFLKTGDESLRAAAGAAAGAAAWNATWDAAWDATRAAT